jgi:hypothetical protein
MANDKKLSIKQIVEKSGNSFHSRVVKLLRDEGWSVLVSPYYSDNFTEKPREIDIIAEKKFDVKDFISDWLGTLNVRLFIECKYINNDIVFWFDNKDVRKATERIMHDTGMEDPSKNITIQQHHYYADISVAKLFASEKTRSEDNDVISKAINQNLNATVYYRNKRDLKIVEASPRGYIDKVLKLVYYPLIVVNSFDNFHYTTIGDDDEVKPITEPFPLEVNYAYTDKDRNGHNEYFLIDVINIEKLPEFLKTTIQSDASVISVKIIEDERENRQARERNNSRSDNIFI